VEGLKQYKLPVIDQVLADINCVPRSKNLIIILGIRNKYDSSGRNRLLYLFIRRLVKLTLVVTRIITVVSYIYNLTNILLLVLYKEKLFGINRVNFAVIDHILEKKVGM
jgi:hypothetical protein